MNTKFKNQSGQTLIETLVAVFILATGIGAAMGLASYSLNASNSIKQQIIGMGLAREGLEAVKHMRDTNWLRDTLASDCFDFGTGGYCYKNWLNVSATPVGYDFKSPGVTSSYYLTMDQSKDLMWELIKEPVGTNAKFGLDIGPSGLNPQLYVASAQPVVLSNSGFGRMITIEEQSNFSPFNQNTGPRLKVISTVWWGNQRCPLSNLPPASSSCKVVLETYLTNWKNY